MVIATQNPFEFEGTYFLPESQLDRFLMRIGLGYPSPADEARVLTLDPRRTALADLKPVMTSQQLVELQQKADDVSVDGALVDYVVAIANATRHHEQLQIGVSPRGSLALLRVAKATALLSGRDYLVPDDVVANVIPVFAHRCISKTYMHESDSDASQRVLKEILQSVPSPV
jgi:MoxR-like ATPase